MGKSYCSDVDRHYNIFVGCDKNEKQFIMDRVKAGLKSYKSMISITDKAKCSGCTACFQFVASLQSL